MRLTIELIANSAQSINPTKDRMISIRGCKISVIENLGATQDHYDCIDLSDNDIIKLANLPPFRRLKTLILCNNRISRIAPDLAENLPYLNSLVLTNNKLERLIDLDPILKCKFLTHLSLSDNPVTFDSPVLMGLNILQLNVLTSHYRAYLIYHLPNLRILDFKRIRDSERAQCKATFSGNKMAELKSQMAPSYPPATVVEDISTANASKKIRKGIAETSEDIEKIKVAIAQATTIEEVNRLEKLLNSQTSSERIFGENLSALDRENLEDQEDVDMEE
ncbi:putative small nuclear ribonucleoprotein polypeptide A' [Cardiosporidium cionae]|uniref:Small nuclear ribonucleoprotein polypeptide A n=1 Tax=Cardiosporidium cionae TaxID=476202 RepID=A0ABQ7JDU3_9APIC|nr:putative small nuclear ribonucleoprotein polypeptide A' [Cardiosporidium cionae]|eukprot:KAF8821815.1 putative small nuclear ribonucleoprotein polypeptide A' [Cardiosporidium cionae]